MSVETGLCATKSCKKPWCRAIRELDRYDPARAGDNVFPWLTGLARNEISRVLSREKNAVSLEALWARMDKDLLALYARLELEPFGDEVLQREETRELVNTTMSQLPPHYREALEAKYVTGKSVRDLAAVWSISEKAAESLLGRARKRSASRSWPCPEIWKRN